MTNPMTARVALARTLLFVPGNRPDRFEKAVRCGADAVVLDLEDSVPSVDKAAARVAIASDWTRLQGIGVPLIVRINTADGEIGRDGIRAGAGAQRLARRCHPSAALPGYHDW